MATTLTGLGDFFGLISISFVGWNLLLSTPSVDPRGWTVSVVYLTRAPAELGVRGADDASDARWFRSTALPKLAFDHAAIIADALSARDRRASRSKR
jgi:ADP-ribose pyrophosphatase YjhB (NUDIX family)